MIRAAGPAGEDKRGHKSLDQAMHHLLELRTRSETARYSDAGTIQTGEYSVYTLRADGTLDIVLEKPPAPPEIQRLSDGTYRHRAWRVTALVFSASDSTVTWPSNVKWGRVGYELSGDPATLSEMPGPPENPRPAGTADLFELVYFERTGEWWANVVAAGVESSDPLNPDEDPNAPDQTPEDPGDEGTDPSETPDHSYTDPVTGDPLTPVQPPATDGEILALHSGAISRTNDGGHTWRRLSSPDSPYNFSTLKGQGTLVSTVSGKALFSSNLINFTELAFPTEYFSEITLENGDFESGDLTGWNVTEGSDPLVLDTVSPAQRGGTYYLASDQESADSAFSVEQSVSVPSESNTIQVSADVLAESGLARIEFLRASVLPSLNSEADWSGSIISGYATAQDGSSLDLEVESGGMDGIGQNGNGGQKTVALKYQNGDLYDRPWILVLRDIDAHETVTFDAEDFVELRKMDGSDAFANVGTFAIVGANSENNDCGVVLKNGRVTLELDLLLSAVDFSSSPVLAEFFNESGPSRETITSTTWGTNDWARRSVSANLEGNFEDLVVRLSGDGSESVVYFDNVSAGVYSSRDETVSVVARDLINRQHFVATASSIHVVKNGVSDYIAPIPFKPLFMAVHAGNVVIADTQKIGISANAGLSFSVVEKPGVAQVLANPSPIAVLQNGEIYNVETDATLSLLREAAPDTSLSWGAKRQVWYSLADGPGLVKAREWDSPESHSQMPRSATAGDTAGDRRVLALDSGDLMGWVPISRDLFHFDASSDSWKISIPLKEAIHDIQEVK
ncbi:hypothetical protein BXY70_1316 [Roseovarius halotolerans]|uniref:Uncharacterized protein n=2 Tax=Roseovarius halotolerans TaxID=505353 RepID=A0A1X6Y688_9RHOB|nr:hypothetical protein BXY70_1316 [Roseovarius halotolerans]SLN11251.1 hypothetical protein ROH8110_00080 [Roseovarius halotolerans]